MRHKNQRGSQVVELAVVLPLLVLLAFAASEGGSMLHVHQVVNNAAREGARIGTIYTVSAASNRDALIQQAVTDYLTKNNVLPTGSFTLGQCTSWSAASDVAVSSLPANTFQIPDPVQTSGNATLQTTQVTVTCPYKFFFLPKLTFFGKLSPTVNLRSSVAMLNTN